MDSNEKLLERYLVKYTRDALNRIEMLGIEEIASLIESFPADLAVLLVGQMDRHKAARSLEKIELGKAMILINQLPISRAEILLRLIDNNLSKALLEGIDSQTSKALSRILKYPVNAIGAYINPKVFTLPVDIKISDGLKRIRSEKIPVTQYIFALERDQTLTGIVDLQDMIIADEEKSIRSIIDFSPPKVLADRNIEGFIKGKEWIEPYSSLAVVDINNVFLGVLSRDSLANISVENKSFDKQAVQAGNALGDLYRIGLSGLFRSALDLYPPQKPK